MNLPGFTAHLSLNNGRKHYYMATGVDQGSGAGQGVTIASIPPPGDPCHHCASLRGCAAARCYCVCNDGIPVPSRLGRCGFLCT
jgi:hypothetical protein